MIVSSTFVRSAALCAPLPLSRLLPARRAVRWLLAGLVLGYLLVLGASSAPSPPGIGPAPQAEAVKAAYLYRFLAFVEWPQGRFASASSPIVVGVLGDPAIERELADLVAERRVAEHPVVVRQVDAAQAREGVDVLFVGARAAAALPALARATAGRGVLIVSDFDDALDLGSVINLVVVDGRVRFEVSLDAAQRNGLRLSSRLLGVALHVRAH